MALKFVFNPLTGQFDAVPTAASILNKLMFVEFTLSGGMVDIDCVNGCDVFMSVLTDETGEPYLL
jgi:hypothetical protein